MTLEEIERHRESCREYRHKRRARMAVDPAYAEAEHKKTRAWNKAWRTTPKGREVYRLVKIAARRRRGIGPRGYLSASPATHAEEQS